MEIVSLFKQSVNLITGSFSGFLSKVIACNLYGKGYLFYSINNGLVNIRIYQGAEKVNLILTNSLTDLNGEGIIDFEIKGMVLKIEITSTGFDGFIHLVLSSL